MSKKLPADVIKQLERNAFQVDGIINTLKKQLQEVHKQHCAKLYEAEIKSLEKENFTLEQEVETLKDQLTKAEIKNGKQVIVSADLSVPPAELIESKATSTVSQPTKSSEKQPKKKSERKDVSKKPGSGSSGSAAMAGDQKVDVSRLLFKIGRITSCNKHPDADTLYIEHVDVGESKERTVVSGLVRHVPIDQMSDRLAVFMCNLKPAKMRGILSEAMIMCASTPEHVEILTTPDGVQPGDLVTCQGYTGTADDQLNPKKKVWEQVSVELKVDSDGVATYKGSPLEVADKGLIRAPTLTNVQIK